LNALRREHASLRGAEWHHAMLKRGSTLPTGRRAVLAAKRPRHAAFALLANGEADASDLALPAPDRGKIWHLVADTAASPPADLTTVADAPPLADQWKRRLEGRSLVLLVGR
jgi:hypothetical protein